METIIHHVKNYLYLKRAAPLFIESIQPVKEELDTLDKQLPNFFTPNSNTSKEILLDVWKSGGKRIRPALFFLCAKTLKYSGPHLYSMAAVSELVHTASLLHDDVIDNSTLRRNRPTPKSIWGDVSSVWVGDLIYARASEMMAETGNLNIVSGYASAIRMMSEGELIQLENLYKFDQTKETYFKVIECKTAALTQMTCLGAAYLISDDKNIHQIFSNYGYHIGIAFQIIDDLLDYATTASILGKPSCNDLAEGKITLPIIYLREILDSSERNFLDDSIKNHRIDFIWIKNQLEKNKIFDPINLLAKKHTEQAISELNKLPPSQDRNHLIKMSECLSQRSF